jgi:hypothetical protein
MISRAEDSQKATLANGNIMRFRISGANGGEPWLVLK